MRRVAARAAPGAHFFESEGFEGTAREGSTLGDAGGNAGGNAARDMEDDLHKTALPGLSKG
ncbi:MAG: hypothetical protein JNL98_01295 [Bryobacterales bacterium]|nr:hypothetical protein [Bryobacterales bacterium]